MSITATCPGCNVRLTLGDDRAGDRFECPNCDATIKVPGAEPALASAPRTPAPAARTTAPPMAEPEAPESRSGPDGRVVGGVIAGVVGLLVVAVAVAVFALRKPPETANSTPEPSTPTSPAPAPAPPAPAPPKANPDEDAPRPADPPKADPSGEPKPVPQFQAQFLGSQGKGRRFCIIADFSNSMRGAKLANLKTQLLKTITDLNQDAEYYVIGFHARPVPMPHPTWLRAGAPETEKVKQWVKDVDTELHTYPTPAFEVAFKLDPPPDVIFFMTDGQFAAAVPGRVVELNGRPRRSVVNTILFSAPGKGGAAPKAAGADDLLKKIAEQNGGTFTRYVP